MKKSIIIGLFLLLAISATAQLDWSTTDLRCGDGVLDPYEMCEEGVAENRCTYLEEWMKIDTACYTDHCTCLPLVNTGFCGNDRRDGVEMCDGSGEDLCDDLGEKMNLTLTCNTKCGCDIADPIPQDYNPDFIKKLENQTYEAECGNIQIEGAEQCDPAGVLCTTSLGEPGECAADCTCTPIEGNQTTNARNATAEETNTTDSTNTSRNDSVTDTATDATDAANVTETEQSAENATGKPAKQELGFFGKLWNWLVSIFS